MQIGFVCLERHKITSNNNKRAYIYLKKMYIRNGVAYI